jgi:hypothetical protein
MLSESLGWVGSGAKMQIVSEMQVFKALLIGVQIPCWSFAVYIL